MRATAKARYDRNRAANQCVHCGKDPIIGKSLCEECTVAAARHNHEWRERRKAGDRCMYCTKPKWQESVTCRHHFIEKRLKNFKMPSWAIQYMSDRLDMQNSRCFYTGVELVAGRNLSVDHYRSQARNPDLANDPHNLVWCDEAVNMMKWDRSPADFVAMCEAVVAHKAAILDGIPPLSAPPPSATMPPNASQGAQT
jgi:hypothetical protein